MPAKSDTQLIDVKLVLIIWIQIGENTRGDCIGLHDFFENTNYNLTAISTSDNTEYLTINKKVSSFKGYINIISFINN